MDDFFETKIPNCPWSLVHKRCLDHPGCIVDLGCLWWDWSRFFIGKKRVIGVDPAEKEIEGAELFKGAISNITGNIQITSLDGNGKIVPSDTGYPSLTWDQFITQFNIENISVLKINIEGSEYDLIKSLTKNHFDKIDQIAVSFHHFINPGWQPKTEESLHIIKNHGFNTKDLGVCGWFLCYK